MQERRQRRARFDALWAAHHDAVRRYAMRREPALADDLAAETFAVAWRRLESVPDEPLPWLYGVARKSLANLRRREAHQAAVAARAGAEPAAAAGGIDRELLEALARLRPVDREALLLAAWEGLSGAELATALGCSRAAAKVRLHRARRRLAAELDGPQVRPRSREVTS